jgi:hypothetical protein
MAWVVGAGRWTGGQAAGSTRWQLCKHVGRQSCACAAKQEAGADRGSRKKARPLTCFSSSSHASISSCPVKKINTSPGGCSSKSRERSRSSLLDNLEDLVGSSGQVLGLDSNRRAVRDQRCEKQ